MTNKEYETIAKKIAKEMINYKTKSKSLTQVYNIILNKYLNNTTIEQNNKILIKTIHFITMLGYDINNIKPLSFKKYKD